MTTTTNSAIAQTGGNATEPNYGPQWRWWTGVVVGAVVGLPLAYLLSLAALLPFYLGLFFFALFGLLIGATTCRVSSALRPQRKNAVLIGTTALVMFCWAISVTLEANRFPSQMAEEAIGQVRHPGGETPDQRREFVDQLRAAVTDDVRGFLAERYPPGGTIGYIRWCMASGVLKSRDFDGLRQDIKSNQGRIGWTIRVVLSIALLAFGIGSQTFTLMPKPVENTPAEDEAKD